MAQSVARGSPTAALPACYREVEVDNSGKMNWETGRGYEGEWQVYWSLH